MHKIGQIGQISWWQTMAQSYQLHVHGAKLPTLTNPRTTLDQQLPERVGYLGIIPLYYDSHHIFDLPLKVWFHTCNSEQ